MAEIIKEFTNAPVTAANLSNDGSTLAVFTNDANTTRVVREVQVQESDIASTDAKFSVDGTIVGDSFEDSNGNLVVPPTKSFDIKLNTPVAAATKSSLTLRHTKYINSSQTDFTPITGYEVIGSSDSRFPYDFSTVSLNTSVTVGTAGDIIPPFNSSQLHSNSNSNRFYAFKVPNEKIWYHIQMDSNSLFNFYKTTYTGTGEPGDTTGSTTQIESRSYGGGAFDWRNNKLYYKAGSEIKEWDLTKAGGLTISDSTQHDLFFSTQSSYGTGAICNNHYFYSYNGYVYIRNLAVASGHGTLQMAGNSSYSRVVALYNEDEDKFYVIQGYNDRAQAYFKSFPAAQTADAVSFGTVQNPTTISTNFNTYMSSITGGSNYNHMTYLIEPLDTNLVSIPYSDNETRLYKAENDGLTYTGTSITVTGGFTTATRWSGVVPIGAVNETTTDLAYSNYSLSTKVRTQGVEIT